MPVIETEEMLVHRDEYFPDKWMIKPLEVSELWIAIFGSDWDVYFSEAYEFQYLYERLVKAWETGSETHGDDILICQIEMGYWFTPPPGLRSLRYGTHIGGNEDEVFYIQGGDDDFRKVVGGFVRAIRVIPLSERDHRDRREQEPEPGEVRRVRVI